MHHTFGHYRHLPGRFDAPNLSGEMQVSIDLRAVAYKTELNVTQEGIPESIPEEFCYLGWQESLEMLARVVEPDILDNRQFLIKILVIRCITNLKHRRVTICQNKQKT
jgi:hypothetical protein